MAGNTYGAVNDYGQGWGESGGAGTPDGINAAFNLSSGVPGYTGAVRTPNALNGGFPQYVPYHQPLGYVEQWQGGFQHQTIGGILVDLAYVGTRGEHLPFLRDINQVPENLLFHSTVAGTDMQQYRPYPQYFAVAGILQDGYSIYHGLQVGVRREFRSACPQ